MNFAYIDPAGLLTELLRAPPPDAVTAVPCELDERWMAFEKTLGEFKSEFAKGQVELVQKLSVLNEKNEEINVLRMMFDNINSEALKEKIDVLIQQYESDEGIAALIQQCGEVKGRVEAQKNVLADTNADRYAKFTCFVCMDRLVDLFFDPCGHVICDGCWSRTQNKRDCPGCRTRLVGIKKIFTMSA
jgi:hypothetical protein